MMPNQAHRDRLRSDLRTAAKLGQTASAFLTVDNLGVLVRDLKTPVASLAEVVDPVCADDLRAHWAELEFLYALRSTEGQIHLSQVDRRDVTTILDHLLTTAENAARTAIEPEARQGQPASVA